MFLLRGLKGVIGPALVASVLIAHSTMLWAQTTSASVSGTIQDSQGGVLPGVTVTVTSRTQGQRSHRGYRRRGTFRVPHRPSGHLLTPGHAPGLQDARADERGRERERQAVGRHAHAGSRQHDRGSQRRRAAVTELQSNSGERSFTLESQALENIASNGRMLFNFATLVPGVLSGSAAGNEIGSVDGFTVNGQRPELQQHHDRRRGQHRHRQQRWQHGDHQHRLRRRVQDPHELLPGGIRARRRRPDAGGHQERHAELPRLGLLVRTSFGLGREHLVEQPEHPGDPETRHLAQRFRLHHRRAGGLSRFQRRARRSCSSSGARSGSGAPTHRRCTRRRCRRRSSGRGTSRRASTAAAIRFRTSATPRTGLPCGPGNTSGCFQDGGVLGRIPANRLYAPGLAALNIFPAANFSGGSGLNFTSQVPDQLAAPRRSAPDGLPGRQQLAHHRPLHEEQGGHHAGVRDDVGRQRQRPAPDAGAVPAPRLQLHAVGDGHPEQHDVARGQLGARRQLAELPAAAAEPVPRERRPPRSAAAVPGRRAVRLHALVRSSAAAGPATRVSIRPIAGRSPTRTSRTTSSRT